MKKTMVRVLTAVLAAVMMMGTAAGCGNGNGSAESSRPESNASATASIRDVTPDSVTEDMIRSMMKGSNAENKENYVITIVDDGSVYGFMMIGMTKEMATETLFNYMDGTIVKDDVTQNDDGTKTEDILVRAKTGMSTEMLFTIAADGKMIGMKVTDAPVEMELTETDKTEGLKELKEIYANPNNLRVKDDVSDAATIDNLCKTYYAAVVIGELSNESEEAKMVKSDRLPDKNATEQERREAAQSCTVRGALEYSGLKEEDFDFSRFGFDADGHVCVVSDESVSTELKPISAATTFREMGYGIAAAAEEE